MYYLEMPSIVGKRQGSQTYYYLVESARVEGKPRIVSQQYLGSAEEVMAKLAGQGGGEPVRSQHKKFGDLAAVWSVLERLDGWIRRRLRSLTPAGEAWQTGFVLIATVSRGRRLGRLEVWLNPPNRPMRTRSCPVVWQGRTA